MDISFYCYKCGQHIVIDEAGVGTSFQCPKCGYFLTVPQGITRNVATPSTKNAFPLGVMLGIVSVLVLQLVVAIGVFLYKRVSVKPTWETKATGVAAASLTNTANTSLTKPVSKESSNPASRFKGTNETFLNEGAETMRRLTVQSVVPAGASRESGLICKVGIVLQPTLLRQDYIVAVVKHPREKTLAEGESFTAVIYREGVFEYKNSLGGFCRLPRFVCVSE